MGQKVNPNGFRVGVNKDWNSTWVAPKKDIAQYIKEDHQIRKFLMDGYGLKSGLNNCSIAKITIERQAGRVVVNIFTAKPGMLIGQKGAGIDVIKREIQKIVGAKEISVNIKEIKNIDADATLVAQSIATQLEKRIAWRRAMKMAMQKAMKAGVKGVKVMVGGRLDGADIARSEHYQTGVLPLHTLRSDIEYGFAEAKTTFGIIGVKCWICHGEIKGKSRRTGEIVRASRTEREKRPTNYDGERRQGGWKPGADGQRKPFDPNRRPPFNRGERPAGDRPQGERSFTPRPAGQGQAGRSFTPRPAGTKPASTNKESK